MSGSRYRYVPAPLHCSIWALIHASGRRDLDQVGGTAAARLFLFPNRLRASPHLGTWQYARIVSDWRAAGDCANRHNGILATQALESSLGRLPIECIIRDKRRACSDRDYNTPHSTDVDDKSCHVAHWPPLRGHGYRGAVVHPLVGTLRCHGRRRAGLDCPSPVIPRRDSRLGLCAPRRPNLRLFAPDQLHCYFTADPLLHRLPKNAGGRDSTDTDEPPWHGRGDNRFADPHLVLDCSGRSGT